MKKILLMLLIALLPSLAAAGPKEKTPQGKARLRLHEKSHHFGDVARRGGDLEHEFRFTNEGDAPLVLTRVVTSCSCLKAHFHRRPVAPGDEGSIRIVYEPQKSEPGVFNKVIQIYSNAADGREVITVQGNALEAEKIKNRHLKEKVKK